ncbi:MAG: penicillin-binding protein 2 [Proteobacteria bacterium]|nr:penicillin-binding protein 2 [Pseudomonadota bacterium]
MKTIDRKYIGRRIHVLGAFFCFLFAVIGVKAIQLQVFECKNLSEKAADEYERSILSAGKRGIIYDRKLNELAVSIHASSIAAVPSQIACPKTAAKLMSAILDIDKKELEERLSRKNSFIWVKRQISPQRVEAIKALGLKGIEVIPEFSRFYPNKTLAAQALGFSGIDSRGLEGIEFFYNDDIEGTSNKYKIMKDALGRGFDREEWTEDQKKANNLVLTIDRTIQYITDEALKDATLNNQAKAGMAVVMVPDTGEILAIAHYPEFNPNAFTKFKRDAWRNKAITDSFEPGSTMKIFLAAAAMEFGYCSPNTIFFCENGEYRIGKNIVHDTHPHDWMSLQQIIKFSSNIGAVKVAEMTGKKSLYKTLSAFGFGEKTGIDAPGETPGSLTDYRKWTEIDTGTIAFGQGVSVSAIQLTTALCAIANGGILMKPYIAKSVIDPDGNVIKDLTPKKGKRIITQKTANDITTMMHSVVTEGGTGVNAALDNYRVCGKTGTAQKVINGRYSEKAFIASFAGFAPQKDPAIAVLVVIDEPLEKQHHGGAVAAPAFGRIVYETLNYMAIKPDDLMIVSLHNGKDR